MAVEERYMRGNGGKTRSNTMYSTPATQQMLVKAPTTTQTHSLIHTDTLTLDQFRFSLCSMLEREKERERERALAG